MQCDSRSEPLGNKVTLAHFLVMGSVPPAVSCHVRAPRYNRVEEGPEPSLIRIGARSIPRSPLGPSTLTRSEYEALTPTELATLNEDLYGKVGGWGSETEQSPTYQKGRSVVLGGSRLEECPICDYRLAQGQPTVETPLGTVHSSCWVMRATDALGTEAA